MIKRVLFLVLIWFFWSYSVLWNFDSSHPYADWQATTDTSEVASDNIWDSDLIDWMMSAVWVDSYANEDGSALAYIQTVINYFLVIVWFVALIVVIYWFYWMLFSGEHEEWFNKAKKYVLNWWIAILVMWISWFIVSFIFYIIQLAI